jgi:hypothetical protein
MGWDPAMPGLDHASPLAMVPRKADYPTERMVGFLVFSYPIVGSEEVRVREWAAPVAAGGK